jgi:hypothetical protein
MQLVPRWHEHWTSNKVYDGDMIVLQGQEKGFLAQGRDVNAQYSKFTFTPTQADRFVLAFRNWLRKHGKSQPDWFPEANLSQPLPSTVLSKYEVGLQLFCALGCCTYMLCIYVRMMQHVIECCNTLSCDVLTVTVVACTFNDNCYIDGFGVM